MVNKVDGVMQHVKDCHAGFAFLTETWLTSITSDVTAVIKSYGYNIQNYYRKDSIKKWGCGVVILYLTKYNLKKFITIHMHHLNILLTL